MSGPQARPYQDIPNGPGPENGPFVVLEGIADTQVVFEMVVLDSLSDNLLVVDGRDVAVDGRGILRIGSRGALDGDGLLWLIRRHDGRWSRRRLIDGGEKGEEEKMGKVQPIRLPTQQPWARDGS